MMHTKSNLKQEQADRWINMFSPWLHIPVNQMMQQQTQQAGFPILANIHASDLAYTLALNVAGFAKEEVKISIENQTLKVVATKVKADENVKIHLREWKSTNQKRSFNLPKDADLSTIEAAIENGVLNIQIQKKAKPVEQTIEVK